MNTPSQRAYNQVKTLARQAAKHDNWLEPLFDNVKEIKDFGQYSLVHRERWEQTDHFETFYGKNLTDIADQQAKRYNVSRLDNWEAWNEFYQELKETFWETWEDQTDFVTKWKLHNEQNRTSKTLETSHA